MSITAPIELNSVDRRIWEEELDEFVPAKVFDAHTHLYRWAFNTDPEKDSGPFYPLAGTTFAEATWGLLQSCDDLLLPGREVHRLSFPYPFSPSCDFDASNRFVAREVGNDPQSGALMLVHPSMKVE
jgi:glutamate-1-semialdehyde 2,1-aminomutase